MRLTFRSWGLLKKTMRLQLISTLECLTIFVKILNDLGNFSSWIPCGKLKSWCEQQGQHSLDALMSCRPLFQLPSSRNYWAEIRSKFESRTYIEFHCSYDLIHSCNDLLCDPADGGGEGWKRCEKNYALLAIADEEALGCRVWEGPWIPESAFAGYGTGNMTPALVRYKNESINRLVITIITYL